MSDEDRRALREAALEWTDTLGGIMAHGHPTKASAAQNMRHYRQGGGRDREYGARSVDNLQNTLNTQGTITDQSVSEQFLNLIAEDMKFRSDGIRRYLARNANFSSPNYGSNWFGVTAERNTGWFYAVGSFWMAYGAHATRQGSVTTIRYRLFIYDRYNWDVEDDGTSKGVSLPSYIDVPLNQRRTAPAEGLSFNAEQRYFERSPEGYFVTDALIGSLVASGDAANFDIVGAGTVRWARFEDSTSTNSGASQTAPILVESGAER
ncbi:MAG: hypothetical protein Q4G24_16170 [Paracoccus sp. (in: a-proteobacteria)]|uniref:hypothetical protein n=1 Tax=Paracoccus sp. TaxID=267 RepID=UPI0026E05D2C|nr:hypothetical protein [Paracoccus sp. (in: a-proteobacteria)]MDO5622983.1 hypothetical protein [Paracoccus sp. (in: a-proteobacteria)]